MIIRTFLTIFISFILMSGSLMADFKSTECHVPDCPFKINLNDLEPLKHNNNIVSYHVLKMGAKKLKVTGKLKDGNSFDILLTAGDVWSRRHRKIIPHSSTHSLIDKQYWIHQALIFAKQVWSEANYSQLKIDFAQNKLSLKKMVTSKKGLLFEKYNEGNIESIKILPSSKETIIELQQSAC